MEYEFHVHHVLNSRASGGIVFFWGSLLQELRFNTGIPSDDCDSLKIGCGGWE